MNIIFTAVFISSMIAILFFSPQDLLPALLSGADNSVKMAVTLFAVYAVWMGLSKLCERSGISKGVARALSPLSRRLFKTDNFIAGEKLAINELEKENNGYAQKLLFVINATSIQILPTTVIALRAGAGSAAAADIFLPSLICTAVSTLVGVILFIAGNKIWR